MYLHGIPHVYKRNSLHPHNCHCVGADAHRRCQSTPVTSHRHCSALICQHASSASGQTSWPRCRRRRHIQTPAPSQQTSFKRVRRRAHIRRRRQPDRLGRQVHHSARINSASQLAGTSVGKLKVQQCSLRKLIATAAGNADATRTGSSAGIASGLVKRRIQ